LVRFTSRAMSLEFRNPDDMAGSLSVTSHPLFTAPSGLMLTRP
jgi:hypothetical protein